MLNVWLHFVGAVCVLTIGCCTPGYRECAKEPAGRVADLDPQVADLDQDGIPDEFDVTPEGPLADIDDGYEVPF